MPAAAALRKAGLIGSPMAGLILPVTSDQGFGGVSPEQFASAGAVFRIERCSQEYFATWIRRLRSFRAPEAVMKFPNVRWPTPLRRWREKGHAALSQSGDCERCWLRGS